MLGVLLARFPPSPSWDSRRATLALSSRESRPEFPARYEPIEHLGGGGGGEVWAVRDRVTGARVALKLLRDNADEAEALALVREATALSGIEGLGVPRVLQFGRLPKSGRAFFVRELVEGKSLAALIDARADGSELLAAVVLVADLVTKLHRALLLHGDIKPANVIVTDEGHATLVDLGLAAHWKEGGARPEGLTPRYAAPELFRGAPLTPQAEVFALGATVAEIVAACGESLDEVARTAVTAVVKRATLPDATERYPSADEFAEALRSAAGLESPTERRLANAWRVVGLEESAAELLARVEAMAPSGGLIVSGPTGSGKSTLLRRVAWSLGVAGVSVGLIERGDGQEFEAALAAIVEGAPERVVLILDDGDLRTDLDLMRVDAARVRGARLVLSVSNGGDRTKLPGKTFGFFELRPLRDDLIEGLVSTQIPSLSAELIRHLVRRAGGYPGSLRAMCERLAGHAVVSADELDRCLDSVPVPRGIRIDPEEIHRLLDRGRFDHAAEYLEAYSHDRSATIAIAQAKLATGRGDPTSALASLRGVQGDLDPNDDREMAAWHVQKARAHLRAGDHGEAEEHALISVALAGDDDQTRTLAIDALAALGLTESLSGRHERAAETLARSVALARRHGEPRMLAIAVGSMAFALQRSDKLAEAETAHVEALGFAEIAGDAGHVATTRLNLAGITKARGDVGAALMHLEAAVDMGRRSGRIATVRQALLNLANLDLYVGRLARARASIEDLAADREQLAPAARAQLLTLEAETATLAGEHALALDCCRRSADAYLTLGRSLDAAEALLERVLIAVRDPNADAAGLNAELERAEALLDGSGAHQSLIWLAKAQVHRALGDRSSARFAFDRAIAFADERGQRDGAFRALVGRAALHAEGGEQNLAATDNGRARHLMEQVAKLLPRDLREVYISDPRRRHLNGIVLPRDAFERRVSNVVVPPSATTHAPVSDAATQLAGVVRDEQLARLLEINRELAGEYDVERLLVRIADHAIALLSAERGFVLLRSKSGEARLSVHAARNRGGDDEHGRFSRSIAERVVESGEPFIAIDAPSDARVADYVSVHQLLLRSVACVPIRARDATTIGALYVETRLRPGAAFASEVPALAALADQAAIALENARLLGENRARADELAQANTELADANRELEGARQKLEEVLGRRTEQLVMTRRDLKSARDVLRGHFGYRGIVGTSSAMRRVYAVIDRVRETDIALLITGESGTGKEVIARAIHESSPRAKAKFVGVNCGAIPENLLEGELFGHVRGAFTGADRDKKGLFRELNGGTILLDEIGEMPPKMQAGLLRVLQEKVVRPVGGASEEPIDTRVIAATHRDLAEMVARGTFREDLYYRLNVIELRVPALRERPEDVPMLIDHFLRIFVARYGRGRRTVTRDAVRLLQAQPWPGNVRQLENLLLNAWILSDADELGVEDFDLRDASAPTAAVAHPSALSPSVAATSPSVAATPAVLAASPEEWSENERTEMLAALTSSGWNRAKAARLLKMPRRTFYRRLAKYGLQ
ncbi:MAG: AAA family ATPase [Myxococcales bacterium]|nr:AAA family ATPase [Myxococcales bacterium]